MMLILTAPRQEGAGTRVLFDTLLKKSAILPEMIKGYDREVSTHREAAYYIQTGRGDAALGIESAAVMMGLDFIDLRDESYDRKRQINPIPNSPIHKPFHINHMRQ